MSRGAASAPGRNDCCGRAGCRRFPEWDTRWCPAMSWSARSSRPVRPPICVPGRWFSSPAPNASAKCAACSAPPRRGWSSPAKRVIPLDQKLGERGILLALAATAYHAIAAHGRVARRTASSAMACSVGCWRGSRSRSAIHRRWCGRRTRSASAAPSATAWSIPTEDPRRDYKSIYDVSGDPTLLDSLISRIAPCGEVVLAGFYSEPLSFAFPPAFMREARIRVAAEWQQPDIAATKASDRIRAALARRTDYPPP